MPTTPESTPNSPEFAFKKPGERMRVGIEAVNRRLTSESNAYKRNPDYDETSDIAKAFNVFDQLATLKEGLVIKYDKEDPDGHDIKPPYRLRIKVDKNKYEELPEDIRLSEISLSNGKALCLFVDKTGKTVNDSEGTQYEARVSLQEVLRWQVVSENDNGTFKKFFSKDKEKELFEAYVNGKFDESLDPAIKKMADETHVSLDEDQGNESDDSRYATGEEDEEEETELSSVEKALRDSKNEIKKKLKKMEENPDKEALKKDTDYSKLKILNAKLQLAEKAGGEYGSILRHQALLDFAKHEGKQLDGKVRRLLTDVEVVKNMDEHDLVNREGFGVDVRYAHKNLDDFLDGYELTGDQKKEYKNAIKDPSTLYDIMDRIADKGYEGETGEIITGLSEGMFGQSEVEDLVTDLMRTNIAEKDRRFQEHVDKLKKAGKWSLIALLIAALVPAAAAVTVASTGLKVVGEAVRK